MMGACSTADAIGEHQALKAAIQGLTQGRVTQQSVVTPDSTRWVTPLALRSSSSVVVAKAP